MLQRVIGAVLVALGVLSAALAVASATVWRPDDVVTASSTSGGAATLLVVEPGVLDLVSDEVTVTASRSDGGEVAVALGREADVRGWVGDDAHLAVTGLASWDALATQLVAGNTTPVEPSDDGTTKPSADASATPSGDATTKPSDDASTKPSADASATPAASPTPTPVVGSSGLVGPDPSGSDMWFASASGAGSASLPAGTAVAEGRTMLLVASVGDGAPAPVLTLSWQREVSSAWLVPGLVLGSLLALAGAAVLLAASRGGLRAVGASTRRSILETSARTAATLSRRGGQRAEPTDERPASPTPTQPPATRPTTPVAPTVAQAPSPYDLRPGPSSPGGPVPAGPADRGPVPGAASAAGAQPADGPARTAGTSAASPYETRPSSPTSGSAVEPAAETGARPLTRRELREQAEREALLAAQEKTRRRPRTGALPAVRAERAGGGTEPTPTQPAPPAASPTPAPTPDDSNTARADAWRRAWGFEQQTWTPDTHDASPARPEEDA
ncbi:hypothetical protein [Sanguibacter massiliensis]|uniref:hypothetical protein n=1 Tax=Sanguibacter massiliensis TaxID=1973217 RepID=UPI000C82B56B|nr:hypothetical protein [Sanguibacter massiliensis]